MWVSCFLIIIAGAFVDIFQIHAESNPTIERRFKMDLEQKTGKVLNTPARVNQVLSKYGLVDEYTRLSAAAVVDLKSAFVDVEYLGIVGVGTPPQYFYMNLDTGSADIWIPSKPCQTCEGHNIFTPDDSSTFEAIDDSWSLRYGDGSGVMGVTAKDTVFIGNASQPDQIIGLANAESTAIAGDRFMDGILGLSFPSLSYTGETTSIVESLYRADQIDEPIVGIYLGRVSDAGGKGEAVFGGVNPDHFVGDLRYIKVTQEKYWQVEFNGMEIGEHTITSPKSSQAIIDTGTTLTVLPSALCQAFHAAVPGAEYDSMFGWRMPCHPATNETVTFILGGDSFPVPITDMIRERSSSDDPSMCYSGVAEGDSPLVIMGDTFLRSYYSVYDFKNARVGLAPSKA